MRKKVFSIILAVVLAFSAMALAACSNPQGEKPVEPVEPITYTVTINGGSGSGQYPEGAPCTAVAEIPVGGVFVGWYRGETLVSENATYKFKVVGDETLNAVTHVDEYASVSVSGGAMVNAQIGTQTVKVGDEVTATAESNQNRQFKHFMLNGDPTKTVTQNPYTFKVTGDVVIEAVYDKICMINVIDGSLVDSNGEVSQKNTFSVGETCTVAAEDRSAEDLYFRYWFTYDVYGNEVQLSELGADDKFSFEVVDTMVIYAKYLTMLKLTVTNGTIKDTEETEGLFFEGDKVAVVADEDTEGHYFSHWILDGKVTAKGDAVTTVTFGKVAMDIEAVYVEKKLEIVWEFEKADGSIKYGDIYFFHDGMFNEFLRFGEQNADKVAGGDIFTTKGIDYVQFFVYTDKDEEDLNNYVATFKFYSDTNKGGTKILSMDDKVEAFYVGDNDNNRVTWNGQGTESFDTLMEYVLGEHFDGEADYYFAIKLVSKLGSGYANSEFSPIDDSAYNRGGRPGVQ